MYTVVQKFGVNNLFIYLFISKKLKQKGLIKLEMYRNQLGFVFYFGWSVFQKYTHAHRLHLESFTKMLFIWKYYEVCEQDVTIASCNVFKAQSKS